MQGTKMCEMNSLSWGDPTVVCGSLICVNQFGTAVKKIIRENLDHDVFRGISVETVKGLMPSQVVVDGKNLFDGGEGIVYLGIGKGAY